MMFMSLDRKLFKTDVSETLYSLATFVKKTTVRKLISVFIQFLKKQKNDRRRYICILRKAP